MAAFAGSATQRDPFNFQLGQTWIRRDEMSVSVVKVSTNSAHVQLEGGRPYEVDRQGRVSEAMKNAADVVAYDSSKALTRINLLNSADAYAPEASKESNPKEAIGDKKVPMWLCSAIAKAHWAAAQFAGLAKYGAWNWRVAGVRTSTYVSAMARHLDKYANGERLDTTDGTHHLGNIMACAAILLEAEYLKKLNDDRSPRADLSEAFTEVEAIIANLKTLYADKNPHHHTINDEAPL